VENDELNDFINDFCNINEIQPLVLGGPRTTERTDEKSDYDFYVYSETVINKNILLMSENVPLFFIFGI